jgi:diguanylate cyclase (GGDEF)-like protein/PAS domain S-box-containing protein
MTVRDADRADLDVGSGEPVRYQVELERLVEDWAAALVGTSYVDMSFGDLAGLLTRLVTDLVEALDGTPFREEPGHQVGATLVRARLSAPASLGSTMRVLAGIPAAIGRVDAESQSRTGRLLAAVSEGFVAAVQHRILDEQEAIQRATQRALVQAQRGWQRSEARLGAVFDGAGAALAVCTLDGKMVEVNPALAGMVARTVDSLTGVHLLDLIHPDDRPLVQATMFGVGQTSGRPSRLENRFVRGDGTMGWATLSISVVTDGMDQPVNLVVVGEDVTAQHHLQQQLRHQAHHDGLTGLPNRERLYQEIEAALRQAPAGSRVGACLVDLDQFKAVNDTLGHAIGDRLLVAVAGRLRSSIDPAEHFLSRVGGDEFVVLVRTGQGPEYLVQLANRLLAAVSAPIDIDGCRLAVSASIGIADQPAEDADPQRLLRAADATMYVAKADGRNRWAMFDPARHAEQVNMYEMIGELPQALDRGEFLLHYQPIVSVIDGSVRGAEALLRWQRPRTGLVPPNTFIPVAEQSGLIVPLGRWVLRQACFQAARWSGDAGYAPPFVSVNVSMRQCCDPRLVCDVADAVSRAAITPADLQLELTETAVMTASDSSIATLRTLADMGVRIVIDDFGIGYSNLVRLRHLPIHGLKLAGTFMAGVRSPHADGADEQIVKTVIHLAHTLDLTVTAEGVETAEQADRLVTLGCDYAQGWHYGAARPPGVISTERPASSG